ncbi:MAG TPA: rhomboid family intramembrane serine protease, partial [Acidobacteriaceae bacterium]
TGAFFLLLLLRSIAPGMATNLYELAALSPVMVLHGFVWQLVTYSFVHVGVLGTALEMLSLWFLGSFLEGNHGGRWMGELYFASVAGAGLTAVLLSVAVAQGYGLGGPVVLLEPAFIGAFGGIFGLLIAFAVLYGDLQFTLFPLPVAIKAKYLVAVYMLIAVANLFGANRAYALAQLGGALGGYLYIRFAPRRRPRSVSGTEWFYKARNDYYRWKRRNAAKKFEVYMRKQNRDVHFDANGKYVAPEDGPVKPRDPKDRSWMN